MKNWRIDIKHKIRDSDLYFVLTSQSALRKKIIHQEIAFADSYHRLYLIVLLPNVKDLSDKSFGLVEITQYIKWSEPQRDNKIKKIVLKGLFKRSLIYGFLYILAFLILLDWIFSS